MAHPTRRELLSLSLGGLGGLIAASSLAGCFSSTARKRGGGGALAVPDDFTFLQLSDTHIGFSGPPNPEAAHTLDRAVAAIAAAPARPDFIVFTGDLSHTTDDDAERRVRLTAFADKLGPLAGRELHFLPGEHDASLDGGAAFRERFGPSRWSFDHKGVHFVGIDNVSDPTGAIGDDGLAWLRADLAKLDADAPIVVFAHRPLFDLYPSWDWATKDGAAARSILAAHRHVTVFYGHIHQDHHDQIDGVGHHAARSLVFPLPAPGSVPEKKPVPWDPARPFRGLGWRAVAEPGGARTELDVPADARTVAITAKTWAFEPARVALAVGVPVVLELTTLDRTHGFAIPDLGVDVTIKPGAPTRVPLTPPRAGTFPFHCSVFCGSGHEGMSGTLEVS